jgi:FKBP-type peptidyl-prolyl cis-trans isomerase
MKNNLQLNKSMKISYLYLFLGCILFTLANCGSGNESPTKPARNAHTTASGTKYVFHKQNPQGKKLKTGDLLDFHLVIRNSLDSIIRNTYKESPEGIREMPFEETYFIGKEKPNFKEVFSQVAEGDSLSFWIKADSLAENGGFLPQKMPKGSYLKFTVKILKIRSRQEINQENQKLLNSQRKKDSILIEKFVEELKKKEKKLIIQTTKTGLKYIHWKEGTGKQPLKNDTINVNYTSKLLNGTTYDHSETPTELTIGSITPEGLEEGIALMKEGGKSTFILPSHLGYGTQGMGEIIPPNTVLVIDIELLKVKK